MRFINTVTLELEEFYDYQIPEYAILSHRWLLVDQEVSYSDYVAGRKRDAAGYVKILSLCQLAYRKGLAYCWIDTCCIDKSSSSELSEAVNSMYRYYQQARVCFAYLADISDISELASSVWFSRGWTLQELIAPTDVVFRNKDWDWIGTRYGLRQEIASITGIDQALLDGEKGVDWYSNAQIMSWAAHRTTSRLEDEAYCLLGLFRVNMPLLYGEGGDAFRRLQEIIMTRMEDNSLFLWGHEASEHSDQIGHSSILASSPRKFEGCNDIGRGHSSQRILFEVTNQGVMISLHRSYDRDGLDKLIQMAEEHHMTRGQVLNHPVGLTIPLGCYRRTSPQDGEASKTWFVKGAEPWRKHMMKSYFLQLILESGKWRRIGIVSRYSEMFWMDALRHQGLRFFAYTNDYVRIYLHHNRSSQRDYSLRGRCREPGEIQYLHLQDASLASTVYELQMPNGGTSQFTGASSLQSATTSNDGRHVSLSSTRFSTRNGTDWDMSMRQSTSVSI